MNKSSIKSGFVIKLSSETAQKLSETSIDKAATEDQIAVSSVSTKTTDEVAHQTSKKSSDRKEDKSHSPEQKSLEGAESPQNVKHSDSTRHESIVKKNDEGSTSLAEEIKSSTEIGSVDKNETSWGEYTPYITYEGDKAIYTDPNTNIKYSWSKVTNTWVANESEHQSEVPGRVYSYENDTHIYTEPDGSKCFWDDDKKAWIPKVDDDFLAYYQMSYGFIENTQKSDEKPDNEKQKNQEQKSKESLQAGAKRKLEPQWFDASDETNTKVYVSNLPLDLTEEEFVNFMQKCGLVMRDPSTQKMKVKLYMDKEHNCFKGDALCTYIKVESVDLALKILDGSDFKGQKVKVERAHFQLKGEYNPALKPKKKKKKELEKIKRIQEKLFDWRPEKILGERGKHEKVVIIKNLFDPSDFDKEVQLILDYQQDLREECTKCGEVRKVVVYDRHPEGVAQVTMKEPEQADAVVQLIHGRWFGKRKITAEIWDGKTKYKIAETDADINKRINKWEKFLEQDEGANAQKKDTKNETSNENITTESIEKSKSEPAKSTALENESNIDVN